jgi:hypothetical protein
MRLIRPITVTDSHLVSTNVPEYDYSLWSGAITYAIGDRVIYVANNVHKVYEAVAVSTGEDPYYSTALPSKWAQVSATNRWKMFDAGVGTQTENAGSIDVTLYPAEPTDSIALINVSAGSVTITITDSTDGEIYNATHSLVDPAGVDNWYDYFYEPTARITDYVVTDLPRYATATVRVLIESPDYAKCGELVLGRSRRLGYTQHGATVGIQDYSVKQANEWGDYTIIERAYSKRATFSVVCDKAMVDAIQNILASYRATPIVYYAAATLGATILYGFYKDFQIDIAYPTISICSITVEGIV